MTNLIFRVNTSAVDNTFAAAPSNFTTVENDDSLIFSAGSDVVIDGKTPLPEQPDYNRAATLLDPLVTTIVAHYFLADVSVDLLKEIHLAGNSDKRYVFCCSFDGATASEPSLEAWDDDTLNTYIMTCLGLGVPNSSWYKAICTTGAIPPSGWPGTPLAGSGASNKILLNAGAGALTVEKDLYFNFHIKIPAGVTNPEQYLPVLLITYTTN